MDIRIGNKRRGDTGEYVGRPTPLGNPFVVGRDGDRGTLIEPYRRWLHVQIGQENPEVMQELARLLMIARSGQVLTLVCWCHPEPCHADVIRSALVYLDKSGRL